MNERVSLGIETANIKVQMEINEKTRKREKKKISRPGECVSVGRFARVGRAAEE